MITDKTSRHYWPAWWTRYQYPLWLLPVDLSTQAAAASMPHPLDLRDVRTIVYTCRSGTWHGYRGDRRRDRCTQILDALGFRNWDFFYGQRTEPYHAGLHAGHSHLLREYEPPLLILEDDIEIRVPRTVISPPIGSQVLYLGGGRRGNERGIRAARAAGQAIRRCSGYGYSLIDTDWMWIVGMLYAHAILWLDKSVMMDVAALYQASDGQIDWLLAEIQHRYGVACLRRPIFFQNDGHHLRETWDYGPGKTKTPG